MIAESESVDSESSCSVPSTISESLCKIWRETDCGFLLVLETCYNCWEHQAATRHDSRKYESYAEHLCQWVQESFSFVRCELLHTSRAWSSFCCQPRRLGAFEVYVVFPEAQTGQPAHFLLHSKLVTGTWPRKDGLLDRMRAALPEVFTRIPSMLQQEASGEAQIRRGELDEALRDLQLYGVQSWEPAEELQSRVEVNEHCLQQGQQAMQAGDTAALRRVVRQGLDLNVPQETVKEWREELKPKNLMVLNMKSIAKRFQHNTQFVAAVRRLRGASSRPVQLDTLKTAIDGARAAGVTEEDLSAAVRLQRDCVEVQCGIDCALGTRSLQNLAHYLDRARAVQLQDGILNRAEEEVARLAGDAQVANESNDLVELDKVLDGWQMPAHASGLASSSREFAAVVEAFETRKRLRDAFDDGQRAFASKDHKALQCAVEQLQDAHVDAEAWDNWTSSLKQEHNFTVLLAVSGAGAKLKKKIAESRLQAALKVDSIPLERLKQAAQEAKDRFAAEDVVAKAQQEINVIEQRLKQVEDAIKRKCSDKAEVLLFKLRTGRVRVEAAWRQEGPLWDMSIGVRQADAAKDWEAMQRATAGWYEENPGADHPAFAQEGSPTQQLRFAQIRVKSLRVQHMAAQLDAAVDHLSEQAKALPETKKEEAQKILALLREMFTLEWTMKPKDKARLLSMLNILNAKAPAAARFGTAMCRPVDSVSPRVVVLLDQSKPLKKQFDKEVKPAVIALCEGLNERLKSPQWGAVAYGPPQRLLSAMSGDFATLRDSLAGHKCGKGEVATHKALREAMDLLGLKLGDAPAAGGGPEPFRLVLNITAGEPEDMKNAEEAFRILEAQGATVVGLGVGTSIPRASLQRISSPGLVFLVPDFVKLRAFLEEAYNSLGQVLEAAASASGQDIIHQLENLC